MTRSSPQRAVVVTGCGTLLPVSGSSTVAFAPEDFIANPKTLRAMHRGFQLTAAAAVLALRDAGLPDAAAVAAAGDPARAGTAVAAAEIDPMSPDLIATVAARPLASAADWGEFGQAALHGLHPFRRLGLLANMAAAHVSILFGLQGPSLTLTSGPEAASQILRECYWLIADDRADLMVCEAADVPAWALRQETGEEAAAALVLEAEPVARARGARVYARFEPPRVAASSPRFPTCGGLLAAIAACAPQAELAARGCEAAP